MIEENNLPPVPDQFYQVDGDGWYIRMRRPGENLPEVFENGFTLLGLVFVLDPSDDPANVERTEFPHPSQYPLHFAVAEAFGGHVERHLPGLPIVSLASGRRFTLAKEAKGFCFWREIDRLPPPGVLVPRFNVFREPDPLGIAVLAMREIVGYN